MSDYEKRSTTYKTQSATNSAEEAQRGILQSQAGIFISTAGQAARSAAAPVSGVFIGSGTDAAKPQATTLPIDSAERKNYPMMSGCLRYFPAALAGVAKTSKLGNDKHNPGQPMHHARGKSTDHGDCIIRHLVDTEDLLASNATPEQILLEASQLAWRALAYSQELHERFGAPLAPGAKE